ncbi:TPA: hypothetical protein JW677_000878 [Escherichia coli]|jgi:hypothetical protein|uniref:hypothetical protein n=1 Tax=Enterobacteriaceae TaxID=543 RepID=UPI00073BFE34|nr:MULTISPECIES: hypothetical protein [Enterobacteriaceae]EEZ8618316.1 hypothetical protein [Escherichia coli O160]MBH2932901.1 hypothetical protein [Serratia marcescens]HED1729145.1 hypothetical protein [Enterobacter hormaechei subsp. xiangfangensis]AQV21906.1 hypothetical protein BE957_23560 [Escherichia coli]ARA16831.1 hypothetical protein AM365_07770 [Escherichia coli]
MANNLFVTYDLIKTKDYAAVHDAIKALGNWAKVTESNWYVNSNYSVEEAARKVRAAMDSDDKLIVVDAKNNSASWYNLLPAVENQIQNEWNK